MMTRGYFLIGLALVVVAVGALADDTDAGARQVTVRAIEGAADGPRSWALVIGVSQYEADVCSALFDGENHWRFLAAWRADFRRQSCQHSVHTTPSNFHLQSCKEVIVGETFLGGNPVNVFDWHGFF